MYCRTNNFESVLHVPRTKVRKKERGKEGKERRVLLLKVKFVDVSSKWTVLM
jgi:hypothetical protein